MSVFLDPLALIDIGCRSSDSLGRFRAGERIRSLLIKAEKKSVKRWDWYLKDKPRNKHSSQKNSVGATTLKYIEF